LLESVGFRVVYEFDNKKSILYVIPIQNIVGKLIYQVYTWFILGIYYGHIVT
jgi:hypothetical protein